MATKNELLWRALAKGPLTFIAQTGANQFAGRTTLPSGSATVTVSTTIVDSNSLIDVFLEQTSTRQKQIGGSTTLASGSSTKVVSNTAIAATSLIFLQPKTNTTVGSNVDLGQLIVSSISAGASFTITNNTGQAESARSVTVDYLITPAEGPEVPVVVTALSEGNYVTFGWDDGQARQRDVTIMFTIHSTK